MSRGCADALLDTAGDAFPHEAEGPEERALAREASRHIAAALAGLSDGSRVVEVCRLSDQIFYAVLHIQRDAGYRTVAFHHLGGLLVAWASRGDEDEVLRNALANLRERQLEQPFAALVGSADHARYGECVLSWP